MGPQTYKAGVPRLYGQIVEKTIERYEIFGTTIFQSLEQYGF